MGWIFYKHVPHNNNLFKFLFPIFRQYSLPATEPPKEGSRTAPNLSDIRASKLSRVSRWALVFSGKYKSQADIPEFVSPDVVQRSNSKTRIILGNYLMAATLAGCILFAISGKRAAERGETVAQMNRDFHREYKEQLDREAAKNALK